MNLNVDSAETIGLIIGLTLTVFIYTYLFLGDKAPYRLAVHILVGGTAAYTAVIVIRQVFVPLYNTIREDPTSSEVIYWIVPSLLALFLLLRRLRFASWLGNNTIALLVGIGAAVALLGAIRGTLWPQLTGTYADTNTPWRGIAIAILAALTLLTFQFTTFRAGGDGVWERSSWQRLIFIMGRVVIMITFGVLFATVLNTSFILLADRLNFYVGAFIQ
jgi:hypothetical protein